MQSAAHKLSTETMDRFETNFCVVLFAKSHDDQSGDVFAGVAASGPDDMPEIVDVMMGVVCGLVPDEYKFQVIDENNEVVMEYPREGNRPEPQVVMP